ncbi:MAG TPA: ABC transporter substrate-binding protein [Pyrinomonadaceae bacterium]|nr:ABC transporter substrate-binding protein [Pyrinomonadaceae bacterium]
MPARSIVSILLALALLSLSFAGCRGRDSSTFVIVQSDNISTLDPVGSPTVDAASERVRVLMFNSLMRKNEKFEYVNDLASEMPKASEDNLAFTFTLRDNVKFHDGRPLTSADVKYTLDTMLASNSGKAASFFEGSGAAKQGYITGVEAPDARTVIIKLRKHMPQLFPNLVTIGIIPQGSAAQQATTPVGTGPYRFKSFDKNQQVLDLEANNEYWEGAPNIKQLRVRVISDANALQAELKSGRVDLVPLPTNLTPDAIQSLGQDANLKVEQFPGSNIVYLGFNCQSAPLDKAAVRQAIAYGIDRERLIKELQLGQAKLAHSILPEESWAYTPGQTYSYDPARAKKILDDAGFKDPDGDGPQMRFSAPIVFKISSGSIATRQYATVMQNSLKEIGLPVEIETLEFNSLLEQLRRGQFQMTTSRWVGGNQDPMFLRDLFASTEIPTQERAGRNRSRYGNPELDKMLEEAVNTTDKQRATTLYKQAQEIISRDLPMLPLWYPANMVIARKTVGNIKLDGSGDWGFVRSLTVENK